MRLADWATLQQARDRLLALLPTTTCVSASTETSKGGAPLAYTLRFVSSGVGPREYVVKLMVRQSRLYMLTLQSDQPGLRPELEGIESSFSAFPVSSMRGGLLSSASQPAVRLPVETWRCDAPH